MKRWLFALLPVLFHASASGQTSWQWVNPLPQGHLLDEIVTIGTDSLIGVGDFGTIIKSTNGGTTWHVTPGAGGMREALYGLAFPTSTTGWAVGVTGQILKTPDRGLSWEYYQLPTIRDLYAVTFASPTHGWIVGGIGTIFSTTDGGITWSPEASGVTVNLYDVEFTSVLNGIAVGAGGVILRTTDGGNSWDDVASGTTQPLYSIDFISTTTGYISGAFGRVLKTVNSGAVWSPQLTNVSFSLYAINFTSTLDGWAHGSFGSIIKTTNGGLSWFEQTSTAFADLYSASFISSTTGYTVGDYGTIAKTTDGGATWKLLSTGTKEILYAAHFASGNVGYATGESGVFARSTDGGYTWTESFSGVLQPMYGVWFVSGSTGWLVGDSTSILRTTNGGITWNDQDSPLVDEEVLNSVYFVSPTQGYIAGDFGTILGTTNAGLTWNLQPVASFTSFLKIRFATTQIGWVTGYGGEIFKTTNAGATWVEQFSPTSQALYGLFVLNQNTVYACGDFGTVLKTTDGGENWIEMPTSFSESFYGIAFSTPSKGWMTGDDGIIVTTDDGGISWTTLTLEVYPSFYDLQLVPQASGGLLFAAGEGGTILCSAVTPLSIRNWTGAVDSSWGNAGNWNPAGIPGKSDSVYIPVTARNPVLRSSVQQMNIGALHIASGASVTIGQQIGQLAVLGNVNVNGTLRLENLSKTTIMAGRDFVMANASSFVPANSTVAFTANGLVKGFFNNLVILDSAKVQTAGNVTIRNSLTLLNKLTLRSPDTLLILNDDPAAFQGGFPTGAGTVKRAIRSGSTRSYRFESGITTVRFDGTGDLPDTVAVTAYPGMVPVGQGDSAFVRRWYQITPQGGSNYRARISLRYDTLETSIPIDELGLFRDSLGVVINMGASDFIDSEMVAIVLDSVRSFSPWYIGKGDFDPVNAQEFTDSVIVVDNGGLRDTLPFGAFPGASDAIDGSQGEANLGPVPGAGTFDARWLIPPGPGSGRDIRNILAGTNPSNLFRLRIQPGPGGYPITVTWHNLKFPVGKFRLRDGGTGGSIFSIDMKKQNSYTVTNASVNIVEIVQELPVYFAFDPGWNIISLPLKPPGPAVKTKIFPTATSNAFYFDDAYLPSSTLTNGVGYWLKFPWAADVGIDGDTVATDTIPVIAGWNMIGTPTLPVNAASIVQSPPGNVTSSYYRFDESYVASTTLQSARGYWVKVNANGQLILPGSPDASPDLPPAAAGLAGDPRMEDAGAVVSIRISEKRGAHQTLHLAERLPDEAGLGLYELPPLPPPGAFDARFSDQHSLASMLDTAEIAITGGTYPVVLAMTAGGDVEFEATTVSSSGTAVKLPGRLRTSAPILISDPATTRVRLVAFAASGTVPDRFELGQNYPNPFNPTTTIPFDLPVSASVTLVVYDILGREVATPVSSGLYPAGSHRAFFDASELGTGVYFYRIDARGEAGVRFVTGKKMLLMK